MFVQFLKTINCNVSVIFFVNISFLGVWYTCVVYACVHVCMPVYGGGRCRC